jgi:hypothetical protein
MVSVNKHGTSMTQHKHLLNCMSGNGKEEKMPTPETKLNC